MNIRYYFGNKLYFCNKHYMLRKEILFETKKYDFEEVTMSFNKFMEYLDGLSPSTREDYLLTTVFWFCGNETCQPGFESLIVYETSDNQLLWLFLESKYEKPRNPQRSENAHGILEFENIETKVKNFHDINNNSKYDHNSYQWFKNVSKLLIYCDYKDFDVDLHREKLNDEMYSNVAIFAEDIGTRKSQITQHFGPTWKHILSHYIGQQYPQSSKQSKLY